MPKICAPLLSLSQNAGMTPAKALDFSVSYVKVGITGKLILGPQSSLGLTLAVFKMML